MWWRLVLACLATWRMTHLLACEDGPFDICVRLRLRLGDAFFGRLMDCFNCLSFWVAVPAAFFVSREPVDLILVWLAVSGAACLLERLGQEPVVIQPGPRGDMDNGVLRAETIDTQEVSATASKERTSPGRIE